MSDNLNGFSPGIGKDSIFGFAAVQPLTVASLIANDTYNAYIAAQFDIEEAAYAKIAGGNAHTGIQAYDGATTINGGVITGVTSLNGITSTEIGYLNDVTSNIQTQLDITLDTSSTNQTKTNGDLTLDSGSLTLTNGGNLTMTGGSISMNSGRLSIYDNILTSAQGNPLLLLSNRDGTRQDSTVNGTISGEAYYPNIQMGSRAWLIGDGPDGNNLYLGAGGGGGNDPDMNFTFKRNVGFKIDPAAGTAGFTEALKVHGAGRFTGNVNTEGTLTSEGALTVTGAADLNSTLDVAGLLTAEGSMVVTNNTSTGSLTINSQNCAPMAGVWLINTGVGSAAIAADVLRLTPISYSCPDLYNTFSQAQPNGSTNFTSQSGGSAVGTWKSLSSAYIQDGFLVYPGYGLIGYLHSNYNAGGVAVKIDFKNTTLNPVRVKASSNDVIRSIKVYYNDVELVKVS